MSQSREAAGDRSRDAPATTAVVTIVRGRADHLHRQHESLRADPPDHWVVVAMDDPSVRAWSPPAAPVPQVVDVPLAPLGLPLAAARNAGGACGRRELEARPGTGEGHR